MGFLNKFLDLKKDDPEIYLKKGKSLILKGDLDEGIKLLKKAISLYPHITNQIYRIAYKLHAGAKSKNKAVGGNIYFSDGIEELESAIAIMELLSEFKPNNADIWLQLGVLYDNHCFFDKAVKAYKRAANLDPDGADGAEALHNLGILYFNKGSDISEIK